jgi:NAD-dependent deacetylase
MALTVNNIVDHMVKHKDAVIIVGPEAADYHTEKPTREMMEKFYTHKSIKRTPEKFWNFFKQYIYVSPDKNQPTPALQHTSMLNTMGLLGSVIIQSTDGMYRLYCYNHNILELHGNSVTFTCKSCGYEYPYMYYENSPTPVPECEQCGKPLRPNVLLYGENYKDDVYNAMKHHVASTHTLILLGMDYTEDPVADLVASFCEMKSIANQSDDIDEHKMAIAIGVPEGYDPNESLGFFEFIVRDNPNDAMGRLLTAFRK